MEDERTAVTLESTENEEESGKTGRISKQRKKKISVREPSRNSLSDREERVNKRRELRHQIEIKAHEQKYTNLYRQFQQQRN